MMVGDIERQQVTAGLMEDYKDGYELSSACSSSSSSTTDEIYLEKAPFYDDEDKTALYGRALQNGKSFVKRAGKSILFMLVPTFLHTSLLRTEKATEVPLHKTAYLDGLRGVAALGVVFFHLTLDWYPSLKTGYHVGDDWSWWPQLPLVRSFHSGEGMVSIFFVISGYVLSAKPLRLMRESSSGDALLSTLASSVFRRGLRLYLPIIFSSMLALPLIRYGYFIKDIQGYNIIPARLTTLHEQIIHWLQCLNQLMNIYNSGGVRSPLGWNYDGHVWTIPVEYRSSILVFVTLLAVSKAKPYLRMIILVASALYNLYVVNWDFFLFLSGTTLAEIHNVLSLPPQPALTEVRPSRKAWLFNKFTNFISQPNIKHPLIATTFLLGVHLLGTPSDIYFHSDYTKPAFGFETIRTLVPYAYRIRNMHQAFWCSIAAVLTVTSISFSPTLQRPFTTRFAQYLGWISYSIYLLHGNILYTLGMYILRAQIILGMGGLDWAGKQAPLNVSEDYILRLKDKNGTITEIEVVSWEGVGGSYAWGYWFSFVVCGVILIWASDIFTRLVDGPCVRFSSRVQRWAWAEST